MDEGSEYACTSGEASYFKPGRDIFIFTSHCSSWLLFVSTLLLIMRMITLIAVISHHTTLRLKISANLRVTYHSEILQIFTPLCN